MKKIFTLLVTFAYLLNADAQTNIFNGEPVQVVGSFNGYSTSPYGGDYRTTSYGKMTTTAGTPTDGRGRWKTVINVQPSGGDVTPVNMTGGGGNGFLFISGPSANRFQNKWVFNSSTQATLDGSQNAGVYQGSTDMGLNMGTAGYYTFVMNDCGYTGANAKFYVGRTTNAPVTVTRSSVEYFGDRSAKVNITTSATPSPEEKIYVRYKTADGDFGAAIGFTVQATGSGTAYSATIPSLPPSTDVFYYVFSSTVALVDLNARGINVATAPIDVNLAAIAFDDNAGGSYTYNTNTILALPMYSFTGVKQATGVQLNWKTASEAGNIGYDIEKTTDGVNFTTIASVGVTTPINGQYNYSYFDANTSIGNVYYRVKQKAANGNYNYSQLILIRADNKNKFELVSANPSTSFVFRTNLVSKATLQVINNNGQIVYTQPLAIGASIENIDLHSFAKGQYIVKLTTADATYKVTTRVVVQ